VADLRLDSVDVSKRGEHIVTYKCACSLTLVQVDLVWVSFISPVPPEIPTYLCLS
jgi:hypothetical protein